MRKAKIKGVLVVVIFLVLTATTGNAAWNDASKRYLNSDCDTPKSCKEFVNSNNPVNPEFKVNILYYGGSASNFVVAGGIRKAFGDKVAIEFLDEKRSEKALKESNGGGQREENQYYIHFGWDTSKRTEPAIIKLRIWSATLENTFSKSMAPDPSVVIKPEDRKWRIHDLEVKVVEEAARWIAREQEISKKRGNQLKNEGDKGK